MRGKNSKLLGWFISLFSFSVLLSMSAYAAPRIFRDMSRGLERLLFTDVRIPHLNDYGTTTVPLVLALASMVILTVIIYLLTQWDGSHLKFFQDKKKPAIAFSIAVSLITIYAVPFVEWIAELIDFSLYLGYILAVLAILFVVYIVIKKGVNHIYPGETAEEYKERLGEKKEKKLAKKEHDKAMKFAAIDHPDPKKAINDAISEIDSDAEIPKESDSIIKMVEVINGIIKNLPVFKNDKEISYMYSISEGRKLLEKVSNILQRSSSVAQKMKGESAEFKHLENLKNEVQTKLDELKPKKEAGVPGAKDHFYKLMKAREDIKKHEDYYENMFNRVKNDFVQMDHIVRNLEKNPDEHTFTRLRETLDNEAKDLFNIEKAIDFFVRKFHKEYGSLLV